jgi:hypothetical protein
MGKTWQNVVWRGFADLPVFAGFASKAPPA